MIGVSSSARSFRGLAAYLQAGRLRQEQNRVAWSASRNLPTSEPELAAKIMRATAAQNVYVRQPVYHLALSFDPGDVIDRGAMERVADRVLAALELQEYQALLVAHRDRGHPHVHVLINRVHPETGKTWDRWKDQHVIQQTLRSEEHALGLRVVPGRLAPVQDRETPDIAHHRRGAAFSEPPATARASFQHAKHDLPSPNLSRVDKVAHDLKSYELVVDLTRELYLAQIDANAARARATQLEIAGNQASLAAAAFDRALTAVYREPECAHRLFVGAVEQHGVAGVAQTMRAHPESFGELKSIERTGVFGLIRSQDTSAAHAASPLAATKGREIIEALRAFEKVAAEVSARRLEDAFMRSLRATYQDPVVARLTRAIHSRAGRGASGKCVTCHAGPVRRNPGGGSAERRPAQGARQHRS